MIKKIKMMMMVVMHDDRFVKNCFCSSNLVLSSLLTYCLLII